MTAPAVLFIGGTGRISAHCVDAAVARGFDVTVLNRAQTDLRPRAGAVRYLRGDARDTRSLRDATAGMTFESVINFVAYTAEDVLSDLDVFRGRMGQYIFISSASCYQTPALRLPITESTPLHNPVWAYSQHKIRAEEALTDAYRWQGVPVTIVRPSHTYDAGSVPMDGQWTPIARMRAGKPVIVHGDGSSLWTLTHGRDFARGFTGLIANPRAIGDSFHITSDEALSWDAIVRTLAHAAGVPEPAIVHVPSDAIAAVDPAWGDGLLGDKTHSAVFDNSKVKALVPEFVCTTPFHTGAREIVEWFDARPERQVVDAAKDATMDWLADAYRPRARS